MRVLISCKMTNLDVHGESIKRKISSGLLAPDHLSRLQADHKNHQACLKAILKVLEEKNITYVEVRRGLFWPDLKNVDAVITVGGDGTVLEASHRIADTNVPVLGVRSSTMSVGYLCTSDIHRIAAHIDQIAKRQTQVVEISRLKARVYYAETGRTIESDPVLNDFLYANKNPAATTRYTVRYGEIEERHKSSGIWVATAAGSSAAIRTAGGEHIAKTDTRFQFAVREPYYPPDSPKYKIASDFFNPVSKALTIENHCEHALLALDGPHRQLNLNFGDTVSFMKAGNLALIV